MRDCQKHNGSIVIFNGKICPLCKMENKLKSIREELEKSMVIMREIQVKAKEAGRKSDYSHDP